MRTVTMGKESFDVVTKEDWEAFNETLDAIKESIAQLPKGLSTAGSPALPPSRPEGSQFQFCPECHIPTDNLYEHLKGDPERHGLVKTVEVVKEVPSKGVTIGEFLAKHDFIDCPECRAVIDEHLAKKGLKIAKEEEAEESGLVL